MTETPEPSDIKVPADQFMRDANADQRHYNEVIAPALGLQPLPLPYPDIEETH